jgi:hypothetical protein
VVRRLIGAPLFPWTLRAPVDPAAITNNASTFAPVHRPVPYYMQPVHHQNNNGVTGTLRAVTIGGMAAVVDRAHVADSGGRVDTNTLTAATTARMRGVIAKSAGHPNVVAAVIAACREGEVQDWANHTAVVNAVWDYVRRRVRFVQDETTLNTALGMPGELELLIEPPLLLAMASPAGDCDDFTMLTGAMLLSAGLPSVEVITICADPTNPARWSHVYLSAALGSGERLTLDCSHGAYPGWEAPQYYSRRAWGTIQAHPAALYAHTTQPPAKETPAVISSQNRVQRWVTPGSLVGAGLGAAPTMKLPPLPRPDRITRDTIQTRVNYAQDRRAINAAAGDARRTERQTGRAAAVDAWQAAHPGRGLSGYRVGGMGEFDWGKLTGQITTGAIDIVKQVTQKPGQFIQTSGGVISSGVPGAAPYPGGGITFQSPLATGTVGTGLSTPLILAGVGLALVLVLAKN